MSWRWFATFHFSFFLTRHKASAKQGNLATKTGTVEGSYQLPLLSPELVGLIADFLFELHPPRHFGNTENGIVKNNTICCVKPSWYDVKGFMQASPETHTLGFERWFSVLTIRELQDWKVVLEAPRLVRELVCLDNTIPPTNNSVLSLFPRLRAVCVNSHADFQLTTDDPSCAYRDVFSTLPPTVRHLEILNAHGPDLNAISCAKQHCPDLESLWLGRCTMFNRTPACDFWQTFPLDHDSYMSCEGTDSYAYLLGKELSPLQNLKSIRFGIYIVPSTVVLAHRLFHTRNLPTPPIINWRTDLIPSHTGQNEQGLQPQPHLAQISDLIALLHQAPEEDICERCWQEFYARSQSAEIRATLILKEDLPSLELVEWMDWFTPEHLGIFSYSLETREGNEIA